MTQFITSFCAGCILIGSLYIICPEGNISKPVKNVFSLIFLLVIISAANIPLKNVRVDFKPISANALNCNDMQISSAEYVFSHTLNSQKVKFSKIYLGTDISSDGSIFISKVVIVSSEPKEKIIKALGELGHNREVEIINE